MIESEIRSPRAESRNAKSESISVLLIEDNHEDIHLIEEMLAQATDIWFELKYADQLSAGLKCLAQEGINVVLLDLSLPDSQGFDTFVRTRAQAPGVPIVVLTGLGDESLAGRAVREGAQDYLVKGDLDSNLLVRSLRYAIERQKMLAELEQRTQKSQALLYSLDNIIQKNPDGIIIVDRAGVMRFVNRAAESLLDRKSEELVGEMFGFPIMAGEKTELDVIRKGRKAATVEMYVVEMEWKGEIVYLASLRDITQHKQAEEQLKHSVVNLAEVVSRVVSARDPYTADHHQRVAQLARVVGGKMGLDKDRVQRLYVGSLLHDIGMISLPEAILSKTGKLTEEEWALVRSHTNRGYQILKDANFPWQVADMALHHHERLDGSGYPHGLGVDKLSLEVRILAVCNVVEAMSSHRLYRPARSKEEVLQEIKNGRGTKYDADVVGIVLQIIENGEFKL